MEIYKDSLQPVEKRVEDLLSRMTLEEKAAQLCGDLPGSFIANGVVDRARLREKFPDGLGRFTQYSLVGLIDPAMIARATNDIQHFFMEETRLGIPVALQSENLCGYPAKGGTIFPAMLNVASTWMPDLAEKMSAVIGKESHAVGINSAMSPVVDVSRDPRWGRTYETFGEDPYLISQMGIHYVRGMQNTGVSCIAKHFLGYAETQAGLNTAVTRINPRELYEVFATPFEAVAKEAGVGGMMASYSEIDGLCVGANREIAHKLLRDTMGFQGMLTSDGGAIWKMFDCFHLSATYQEAGLLAKRAGLDTEIPVGEAFRSLPDYVRDGQLEESLLDESVRRILTIKFNCGLFEHPYVEEEKAAVSMTAPEKQNISEIIAEKSMILLKNETRTLPLKKGARLAVIGPHADSLRYPVSGYTYPAYVEMIENSKNTERAEQISFNGIMDERKKSKLENKEKAAGPFDAVFAMFDSKDVARISDMNAVLREEGSRSLREVLNSRFEVRYAQGCGIIDLSKDGFPEAVEAARQSDVVIMALGGNCGWVNVTGGEGKDRCHLDLPGVQEELLETVTAVGKPVVLVLYGPGCFSVGWAQKHVQAIVQAWLPGPYGARAVADVLDGTANPGGKLPVTIPRSVGQVPVYYNHRTGSGYADTGDEQFCSDIFSGGYVDEDNTPLYPFGYGLSYTDFHLSDFSVEEKQMPTDGEIHISCSVSNTGGCPGDEVVQLYTHFNGAHIVRPNKQLAGFVRVSLKEGERKTVRFTLDTAQLGYYNEDMAFVVEPGVLDLMVGTNAHDLPLRGQVALTGKPADVLGRRSYTCKVTVQ
ncbi:glycoside hydrolase family 3 N-terminal domain-containing protein [Caproicibacter sp. BJN0012]|uniref:glycoside hydrolase family 3 N-terminal domain-containing protein n=1 Tax=Caproicibacter sp. BJN0012 TaxID=3110227 RepID=UPI002E0E71A5|nr:glycoside hydrolase family 3 N-terminal domain-containing protein [Caproicibacter sp. BJN0012]